MGITAHEDDMKRITLEFADSCRVKQAALDHLQSRIVDVVEVITKSMSLGGKVIFCGNGGSAADAQHLAAEFVGKYLLDRPAAPALALNCNTSSLTAIGNDFGYDESFSRQIQAFARDGDVIVGISTSGNSKNVVRAFEVARQIGCITIGMTGQGGGAMAALSDVLLDVPSRLTPRIQESHITIGHVICGLVESRLFGGSK